MGTNYYAVSINKPEERVHIGKSSCGWLFLFHETDKFKTYEEVKKYLKEGIDNQEIKLLNEYNEYVTYEEFIEMVDKKQKDPFNMRNKDNFRYAKNVNGYRFNSSEFC